jgi:hypothetical protein
MLTLVLEFSGASVLNGKPTARNNCLMNTGMFFGCLIQTDVATLPLPSLIWAQERLREVEPIVRAQFTSLSHTSDILFLYVLHCFCHAEKNR